MIWQILITLAAFLGASWASYHIGFDRGLESKIPDESLPCGHHRNPHLWSCWNQWGELRGTTPPRVVGMIQYRSCTRCGLEQFHKGIFT